MEQGKYSSIAGEGAKLYNYSGNQLGSDLDIGSSATGREEVEVERGRRNCCWDVIHERAN